MCVPGVATAFGGPWLLNSYRAAPALGNAMEIDHQNDGVSDKSHLSERLLGRDGWIGPQKTAGSTTSRRVVPPMM